MQNQPFFSIVIPTLNEEKYLPKLLKDLSKQSFFKDKFEVIVVDASSDDKTTEVAEKFSKTIELQVFSVKKRNVAYQRNFGATKSKGKWVVFMDADNRLPNSFLDGIKYQISKHKQVDIFTSWLNQEKHATQDIAIIQALNLGMELQKNSSSVIAFGAFIGARKKVVKQISFDESQKVAEDSIFVKSAISKGFVFEVFKEPRYVYSLRRLKKEGLIKMVRTSAQLNLRYFQGKDFKNNNFGYEMKGGKYYEDKNKILSQLNSFVKNTSKAKLKKAQKLLKNIKDPLDW